MQERNISVFGFGATYIRELTVTSYVFLVIRWYCCSRHNDYDNLPTYCVLFKLSINSLRPMPNGRHFADISNRFLLNENRCFFNQISLKFVPTGPVDKMPLLLQVMDCHRTTATSLHLNQYWSSSLTHVCVSRPQRVKSSEAELNKHYNDVKMSAMGFQITSLTNVYSTVHSGTDQIKYQSSASLAFLQGIHRSSLNFPHKGSVTRKMFPFDDVILFVEICWQDNEHLLSHVYMPSWLL